MSLTSYRAAPPRVVCATVSLSRFGSYGLWHACVVCLMPQALVSQGAGAPGACVGDVYGCRRGRFRRPGGDRLSRTLGCSIMGAGGFHVRVRDGIGCGPAAMATRSSEPPQGSASSSMSPRGRAPRLVCEGAVRVWWMGVCVCVACCPAWMIAVHGRAKRCFALGWWEPFGRLGPVS